MTCRPLLLDAHRQRDQALDTLERLDKHISDRLRDEYVRRAEMCVPEIDELEAKQRTIEAGLIRLEDNLLRVRLNVTLREGSSNSRPSHALIGAHCSGVGYMGRPWRSHSA